jgi:uncharacterized protein
MKNFTFNDETPDNFKGATDFNMRDVIVTDPYESKAYANELKYLKSLDPDRLLKGFRDIAGIQSNGSLYDGWERSALQGHTMGHYLSALAQAYAQSGDKELLTRIGYIVKSLAECQNSTTGYLAAIPEDYYDKISRGDTKNVWAPWYTMHKVLAGLVKVYELTGNSTALKTASRLGDWTYGRTSQWDTEIQSRVFSVEYGGMNDVLYELYRITKNKNYLAAAHSFDEEPLFKSFYEGKDILNGVHANTTIPKIIGAVNRYRIQDDNNANSYYLTVAENFWDIVVHHHTYITGGNSENEHFGKPDMLAEKRTNCNCETCNVYNMLKLSKILFECTGNVKYLDYYETTFRNDIIASQNPETGMTTYFQPMAAGYFKVYSKPYSNFWCCTGTGMENFTKLNDSIYYKDVDTVYIAQYVDSELTWKDKNLTLIQHSSIPESDTTIFNVRTLTGDTTTARLKIRIPDWCAGEITVTVNGKKVETTPSGGFIPIGGNLHNGDIIKAVIPMQIRAAALPDSRNTCALTYGPVVLCAQMGTESMLIQETGVNVAIPTKPSTVLPTEIKITSGTRKQWMENITENVMKTPGKMEFKLKNTNCAYTFVPFYSEYKERYGIYFTYTDNASEA